MGNAGHICPLKQANQNLLSFGEGLVGVILGWKFMHICKLIIRKLRTDSQNKDLGVKYSSSVFYFR